MTTDRVTGTQANGGSTGRRDRHFLSLRWKMLVGFTLLFTVVFAAAFYWFYTFASSQALDRISNDLSQTLQGAVEFDAGVLAEITAEAGLGDPQEAGPAAEAGEALGADEPPQGGDLLGAGDAPEVGDALGAGDAPAPGETLDASDPRVEALLDWLDLVHQVEPRAWPYIYVPGDEPGEIVFVADLYSRYDPSRAAGFLESYSPITEFPVRGLNEAVVNSEPYTDDWGYWISGYAPLTTGDGEVVGALGVDFGADHIDEVRTAIADRVAIAFAITYAVLFILVYMVARAFTMPISRLTLAAETIGEGDYQSAARLDKRGRWQDEIGILTGVFAEMASKIYFREQSLKREVEVLRIEIDESKRQQQVSEIVESDFFRDLKRKAVEIRKRSSDYSK